MSNAAVFAKISVGLEEVQEHFKDEFLLRVTERTPRKSGALQKGWKGEIVPDAIEVGNEVHYAPHIEYGTIHIAPFAMLRTTVEESDLILAIAMERAGLK